MSLLVFKGLVDFEGSRAALPGLRIDDAGGVMLEPCEPSELIAELEGVVRVGDFALDVAVEPGVDRLDVVAPVIEEFFVSSSLDFVPSGFPPNVEVLLRSAIPVVPVLADDVEVPGVVIPLDPVRFDDPGGVMFDFAVVPPAAEPLSERVGDLIPPVAAEPFSPIDEVIDDFLSALVGDDRLDLFLLVSAELGGVDSLEPLSPVCPAPPESVGDFIPPVAADPDPEPGVPSVDAKPEVRFDELGDLMPPVPAADPEV